MSVTETTGKSAVERMVEEAEWIAGYDAAAFRAVLNTVKHPAERAAREAAFQRYAEAPTPHSWMEEWRRTDPARLPFARMRRLSQLPAVSLDAGEWDEAFDVVITLSDQGWQIRNQVGEEKSRNVFVGDLSRAFMEGVVSEEEIALWAPRPDRTDKAVWLPEAFWNAGFCIKVAEGIEMPRGVLIRYSNAAAGAALIARLLVSVGSRSRVRFFERHDAPVKLDALSVFSKRVHVGKGSQVFWATLRAEGEHAVHVADEWFSLERDARLQWTTMNLGGRLTKVRFTGDAREPGASAELDGLYFGHGERHTDQKTLQIHSSPDTFSRLLYKGVVKDRAYSVYQGQIIARPGAMRVDAYQKNNNLVLNDGARADSMPGLQIDADDLKCSHGSTIGNLDEEQLFYLRCRGVDETTARAVLIHGFFEEILQRVWLEPAREAVAQQIAARIKT